MTLLNVDNFEHLFCSPEALAKFKILLRAPAMHDMKLVISDSKLLAIIISPEESRLRLRKIAAGLKARYEVDPWSEEYTEIINPAIV